jgi:hypothetical protein
MVFSSPLMSVETIRGVRERERRQGADGLWLAGSRVSLVDLQETALHSASQVAQYLRSESPQRAVLLALQPVKSSLIRRCQLSGGGAATLRKDRFSWKSPCGVDSMNGKAITAVLSSLQTRHRFFSSQNS